MNQLLVLVVCVCVCVCSNKACCHLTRARNNFQGLHFSTEGTKALACMPHDACSHDKCMTAPHAQHR